MTRSFENRGLFIALEGGEGSGKSTQSTLLAAWITKLGRDYVLTRQPGGTEIGQKLRSILLDPATGAMSPRTEALLYLADKAEHVDALIRPALTEGAVVVCDRYVESMLAYQGAGRDLRADDLASIAEWATGNLRPDLTIVLDIDPRVGLSRAGAPDRIEAEPVEFHDRVREHFLRAAAADPDGHVVVSADADRHEIHATIRDAVQARLEVTA